MAERIFNWLQNASWLSHDLGVTSWTSFCVIVVLAQALLVPISPFAIYAGFTFGFWSGVAIILVAKMSSAFVNFSLSRWVARDWGNRLANKYPLIQSMNELLLREGLQFVILLRLCPIPFGIANYGCGLTKMPLRSFVIATLISIIIPSATMAALGASLHQGLSALKDHSPNHTPWQAIATLISVVAITLVARRITLIAMKRVKEAKSALDFPPPPNT